MRKKGEPALRRPFRALEPASLNVTHTKGTRTQVRSTSTGGGKGGGAVEQRRLRESSQLALALGDKVVASNSSMDLGPMTSKKIPSEGINATPPEGLKSFNDSEGDTAHLDPSIVGRGPSPGARGGDGGGGGEEGGEGGEGGGPFACSGVFSTLFEALPSSLHPSSVQRLFDPSLHPLAHSVTHGPSNPSQPSASSACCAELSRSPLAHTGTVLGVLMMKYTHCIAHIPRLMFDVWWMLLLVFWLCHRECAGEYGCAVGKTARGCGGGGASSPRTR